MKAALLRLSRADDVRRIAVMPDVHLAGEVCVGTVLATNTLVYPSAVGGDIGCGMATVAMDCDANELDSVDVAPHVLEDLLEAVPIERHRRARAGNERFDELARSQLSDASLDRVVARDGFLQFATLGRGNHFLEFQRDEEKRLWIMVHTGSRGIGQAIHAHHLERTTRGRGKLYWLDTSTDVGRAYLHDMEWARRYAHASRLAILEAAARILTNRVQADADFSTLIACDHNHVAVEQHDNRPTLVHRKGATPANDGQPGLVPGSMGTFSVHTLGRGCPESLCSSSHGAGRRLTRDDARRHIRTSELEREMHDIWFDGRKAASLVEESPQAYRDLHVVMRAQRELVKVTRRVYPVVVYKG